MATPKQRGTLDKKSTASPATDKPAAKKPKGTPKPAAGSAAKPAAKEPKGAPKPDSLAPDAPLNREERRAARFGRHRPIATPTDPWPQTGTNPAFGSGGDDSAAYAGRPDQDVTRQTGPGTGGATQESTQRPEHEGAHAGQSTKG